MQLLDGMCLAIVPNWALNFTSLITHSDGCGDSPCTLDPAAWRLWGFLYLLRYHLGDLNRLSPPDNPVGISICLSAAHSVNSKSNRKIFFIEWIHIKLLSAGRVFFIFIDLFWWALVQLIVIEILLWLFYNVVISSDHARFIVSHLFLFTSAGVLGTWRNVTRSNPWVVQEHGLGMGQGAPDMTLDWILND